jgi:hypothetical protein
MKCFTWIIALVILSACIYAAERMESYEKILPEIQKKMDESRSKLVNWLNNVDRDAFLPGKFLAKDKLILNDYSVLEGKVLDYGPYLILIDKTKRWVMPRGNAEKFELSWGAEKPQKPNIPDLDATFIERLPRYRTNHGNNRFFPWIKVVLDSENNEPAWPPAGTKTTFKAHVVNKGPVESKPFKYEWLIDGKRVKSNKSKALKPSEEMVFDYVWTAKDGSHTVSFKVIPDGEDFSLLNNTRTDRTDSSGLMFICARSTYEGFNNVLNMVETYSFEDWLQHHLDVMNFLFQASIHPGSPEGCFERVRIDQFVVVDDDMFKEENASKMAEIGRRKDGTYENEGRWSFSPWSDYEVLAQGMGWGLIHELGHQVGIVDYYTLDFGRHGIFSRDKNGDIIDVGTSYPYEGMMRGHGPVAFEEVSAVALNLERGKHHGGYGDYLMNVPKECGIRILDATGNPIPNAELRIFRRASGVCSGSRRLILMSESPVFEGKTDENGVFMLPNEKPINTFTTYNGFTFGPSPFGDSVVPCDTGLFLVEIWKDNRRDIQFTDVTEFVKGKGRGFTEKYIDDIETILPNSSEDALKPPQIISADYEGSCDIVRVRWNNMERKASKLRIYRYRDGLPFINLWKTEVATFDVESVFSTLIRTNGWITMTCIDRVGNESAPSEPYYIPRRYITKMAVNSKNEILWADFGITKIGADGKMKSFPIRASEDINPTYWVSESFAIAPNGNFIVTNSAISKIGVFGPTFDYAKFGPKGGDGPEYEIAEFMPEIKRRDELAYKGNFPSTKIGEGLYIQYFMGSKGNGDGQLEQVKDIDLDKDGNIFIADSGNNRIVVFALDGKFIANAGAGKIEKPLTVEVDTAGNIYIIQQGKPGLFKIAKNAEGYADPVELVKTVSQPYDITSDANGRIFLAQKEEPGLIAIDAAGAQLGKLDNWNGKNLREISGLEVDRTGSIVCALGQRGDLVRIPVNDIIKAQ